MSSSAARILRYPARRGRRPRLSRRHHQQPRSSPSIAAGERDMYGIRLPGRTARQSRSCRPPIITPTTKAGDGATRRPACRRPRFCSFGLLTREPSGRPSRAYALALFARGQATARPSAASYSSTPSTSSAPTSTAASSPADEIHTPDSSRYWISRTATPSGSRPGKRPQSFDKDLVRRWVAERCDPYRDAIPEISPGHAAPAERFARPRWRLQPHRGSRACSAHAWSAVAKRLRDPAQPALSERRRRHHAGPRVETAVDLVLLDPEIEIGVIRGDWSSIPSTAGDAFSMPAST